MPETRILSTHVPHSTGISPYKPIHNSNQGATAGAYVTASPAAGAQAQQYVQETRQQMSVPPGYSPPGVTQSPRLGAPPQAARVQIVDRRQSAGIIRVGASSGMSDFSQPRVEIVRGPAAGAGQAQVAPGGVPLALEEMMMVGFLANQFQQTAQANGDAINADLADRVLQKVHAVLQSQYTAAQVAPPTAAYAPPAVASTYAPPQPSHDQAILAHVEQTLGHPAQPSYPQPQPGYPPPSYPQPQPGYPQPGYPAALPVQPPRGVVGAPGVQLIGPTTPPSVQVFPSRPAAPRTAGAPVHVPPPGPHPGTPASAYSPPVMWGGATAPFAAPTAPVAAPPLPWAPPAWMYPHPRAERVVVPPPGATPPVASVSVGTAPPGGAPDETVAAGEAPATGAPDSSAEPAPQVSQVS